MSRPTHLEIRGDNLVLTFKYSKDNVALAKSVKGSRFLDEDKGGPAWSYPLQMDIALKLRERFGPEMTMSKEVSSWAKEYQRRTRKLSKMSSAESAELERLPDSLPKLHDMVATRPFQLADIAYMAAAPACMNLNEPGTGKTPEIIGSVFEAGIEDGSHLITAPVSSLTMTWEEHLLRFDQPHPVLVAPPGRLERTRVLQAAMDYHDSGQPFWLVINPAMVQLNTMIKPCDEHAKPPPEEYGRKEWLKRDLRACTVCDEEHWSDYPELELIEWNTVVFDEFQDAGLGNPQSLTYKGFKRLKAKKKIAASGSPIGGKPIKLYGVLSFMYPRDFTSSQRFADDWLVVTEEYTKDQKTYKKIQGVRRDREQAFWEMMSSYSTRRTMDEIAPEMPPVQYVDLWVDMDPKQAEQYDKFAADAEIRIDDYELSAVGILAEYARLKQFANAEQMVQVIPNKDPDKPPRLLLMPTQNSPKLPAIEQLLRERGIVAGEDATEGKGVIICSESTRFINMVNNWLKGSGIGTGLITGDVNPKDRNKAFTSFQEGEVRVMCLNTMAGGVSLNLDQANTVLVLDETWNPDNQYQVIRRGRRLSNIHEVTAYFIRTRRTIQEAVQKKVKDKSEINDRVIDFRRLGLFRP